MNKGKIDQASRVKSRKSINREKRGLNKPESEKEIEGLKKPKMSLLELGKALF